eukprot:106908-Pelagomonas_calceolata.AAC.6
MRTSCNVLNQGWPVPALQSLLSPPPSCCYCSSSSCHGYPGSALISAPGPAQTWAHVRWHLASSSLGRESAHIAALRAGASNSAA